MKKVILFFAAIVLTISSYSQDSTNFKISADIVSRFVWRGQYPGGSFAHIQPLLYYSKCNFEIGAWGTYAISGEYKEVDLYVKYYIKDFSITATNYYMPVFADGSVSSFNTKFYNFNSKTTANQIELALQYKNSGNFPIGILVGTFIYGNDHNYGYKLENDDKNYYSTYIELNYTTKNSDIFIGMTPKEGFYGNTWGVINIGVKGRKNIKISNNFSIPVFASLVTNPQAESIYAVFGLTL